MRKSRCRSSFWIAFFVTGGFGSLLLFSQTATIHRGVQDVTPSSTASLQTGPYYALVIGNNNYKYLPKLKTAVNDAYAVAQLLRERYSFQTQVLLNADRNQILTALVEYRRTLPENSNLLIYYAGHGHHDRDADEAYWLPVDALADNDASWISADDITSNVRAVPSSHVLVISDSCYSGFMARDADAAINPQERSAYLAKMLKSRSRNLMSSGGDEPVADNGTPGHSVFAGAILDSLNQIEDDKFTAANLFQRFIQPRVGGRSDQLPQYSWIRNSGHDAGDFVFSRTPVANAPGNGAMPTSGADSPATMLPGSMKSLGWGVGWNGNIVHTEDGGRSWQVQNSGAHRSLFSVFFTLPSSGWAVGDLGTILHTNDGGDTWNPVTNDTSATLYSVAFPTPQSGWAVGDYGTILHNGTADTVVLDLGKSGNPTTMGGDWKEQHSGTDAKLYSVAFVTPQSGWVVGEHGTILHTEDGGRSWKKQRSYSDANLYSVTFVTPQSGWAVGEGSTILHTEDGGTSWKKQNSGAPTLRSVAFVTTQSGWTVGDLGTILHTTDSGKTWKHQETGADEDLTSVAFSTTESGLAVGASMGLVSYTGSTILHTEDGGGNWQPEKLTKRLSSIVFLKTP